MRPLRLFLMCVFGLPLLAGGIERVSANHAFKEAAWVVIADVGEGVYLDPAKAMPLPERFDPEPAKHPDGVVVPLPIHWGTQQQLFDAKVVEALKSPAGQRAPKAFSMYEDGLFSTDGAIHLMPRRRMALFLVPAVLDGKLLEKHPVLKEAPRWTALLGFPVDRRDPQDGSAFQGKDVLQGLREVASYQRPRGVPARLAAVKRTLRTSRSMFGTYHALEALRALHLEIVRPSMEDAALPPSLKDLPRLLVEAGTRWAMDAKPPAWFRRRIALTALAYAKDSGARLHPRLVLRLLEDAKPSSEGASAIQLLDGSSFPKALEALRAWMHGSDATAAREAMMKLAEHRPDLLEAELQADDMPPMGYAEGLGFLQARGHALRYPVRHRAFLDLDPRLRQCVSEAWKGNLFHLEHGIEYPAKVNQPSLEAWRQALPLVETLLNDPDPARSAAVVRAFRTFQIPLRLSEGKYVPDYHGTCPPAVSLRAVPPERWREDAPQRLDIEEDRRAGSLRVDSAGTWVVWALGPGHRSTSQSMPDPGSARREWPALEPRRSSIEMEGRLGPGSWTLIVGKKYTQDDRENGGVWTGIAWAAPVQVQVVP